MRAGSLKHKLRILRPGYVTDKFGGKRSTWTETAVVHAERVRMSGRRKLQDGELSPDYFVEWNIRDAHEVHENWRVEQLGGNLYTVTYIIPNYDRGYLTLVCDKVNE